MGTQARVFLDTNSTTLPMRESLHSRELGHLYVTIKSIKPPLLQGT